MSTRINDMRVSWRGNMHRKDGLVSSRLVLVSVCWYGGGDGGWWKRQGIF